MFKYAIVLCAVIACVAAKPGFIGAPLAYTAPGPVITATSSQVVARTHNGIVAAPIVAPVAPVTRVVAPAAKLIAPAAYHAPVVPAAAPVARIVAPLAAAYAAPHFARYASAAYPAPVLAKYTAATPLAYSAPFGYPSPLAYAPSYAASYAW